MLTYMRIRAHTDKLIYKIININYAPLFKTHATNIYYHQYHNNHNKAINE